MTEYDAGSITTNGITTPITVDEAGNWRAQQSGTYLQAETRDKLRMRLARLTRQAKTPVEVHVVHIVHQGTMGITRRRAVLTGLHASNGNVLVVWAPQGRMPEEKGQLDRYGRAQEVYVAGDVTDDQLQEYAELEIAAAEAKRARDEWLAAHKVDPTKAVQQAIEARLGTEE